MTTKNTIDAYFEAFAKGGEWASYLSDDLAFTNHAHPVRSILGRGAYLAATARFFGMISQVELLDAVIEGDRAFTAARYTLTPPMGEVFTSDVAEALTVREGKIVALDIFFDTAPYPAPTPSAAE